MSVKTRRQTTWLHLSPMLPTQSFSRCPWNLPYTFLFSDLYFQVFIGLFFTSCPIHIACNADRCNSHGRSVPLSFHPSITFRCFVQTNEDMIVWPSVSSRTTILVSGEVKFIQIFTRATTSEGIKVMRPRIACENLTNNRPYLGNGAK